MRSVEEIIRRAVTALQEMGYDGKVFYRTAATGHTHCVNAVGPLSLEDESALKAFEEYDDPVYARFNWAQIVEANEVSFEERKRNGRSTGLVARKDKVSTGFLFNTRKTGRKIHFCIFQVLSVLEAVLETVTGMFRPFSLSLGFNMRPFEHPDFYSYIPCTWRRVGRRFPMVS